MLELLVGTWALWPAIAAFIAATIVIGIFGSKLAGTVDRLADRTGMGEAIAGAVLLAGANSIAGLVVSLVAALADNASLAVSNSVGGIAAQTSFIVLADLVYREVNLEHAAASVTNIFNSLLMLALLAVVLVGATSPPVTFLGIHPVTVLLLFMYGYGLRLSRRVQADPMWRPKQTAETRLDEPEATSFQGPMSALWVRFAVLGLIVTASGYVVARGGLSIIAATGLSGDADLFVLGWTMILVGIVTAGLVRREREGIGFEGYAVLVVYVVGLVTVAAMG